MKGTKNNNVEDSQILFKIAPLQRVHEIILIVGDLSEIGDPWEFEIS